MKCRRGCTTHYDGCRHAPVLQFLHHLYHLVQRGGDESRQSYHADSFLLCRAYYGVAVNHHAEVFHVIAVTLRHHAHDVLSYVVNVALDGCHEYQTFLLHPFLLHPTHKWFQHCYGFFHHSCRLHHLRQEHLSCTEEFAHLLHCRHQVVVYHAQCSSCLTVCLQRVSFYRVGQAFEHGVGDAVGDP